MEKIDVPKTILFSRMPSKFAIGICFAQSPKKYNFRMALMVYLGFWMIVFRWNRSEYWRSVQKIIV